MNCRSRVASRQSWNSNPGVCLKNSLSFGFTKTEDRRGGGGSVIHELHPKSYPCKKQKLYLQGVTSENAGAVAVLIPS